MLVNFDRQNVVSVVLEDRINVKHENEMDIFEAIDENESKHKCKTRLRHGGGKQRRRLSGVGWVDDSDEEIGNFDQFSDMMNNMGGEDDLPDLDGADDHEPADLK